MAGRAKEGCMSQWWFTADHHFGHFAMINHANRPFNTDIEMDETMIAAWNDSVHRRDIVVYAGDFTMHPKRKWVYDKYIRHLNGNIIWIKGNHDWWMGKERHIYHKQLFGQGIAVSHYPMRTWKNHQHGWWQLHGHSHGTLEPFRNQLDVGVDVAVQLVGEYRPLNYEEIEYIMQERRDHAPLPQML
jgi:calcineurin-like phosphoesterase family protein